MSRVLIVDDDERARTTLAQTLERHGFTCAATPSIEGAMTLIRAADHDVILLNPSLGPQAAIEMQRSLRAVGRHAPGVVFISSQDADDDVIARVRLALDGSRS